MKSKTYCKIVIIGLLGCLILVGGSTAWIDPYFHYHAPIKGFAYNLEQDRQRYINDGITKNFQYNAIITGTSMTNFFRTSEFDELFDVYSIKLPYSAGYFKEINDNIIKGLGTHKGVSKVLRCLDYTRILVDKDVYQHEGYIYPDYLYDNNFFNDIEYLFNKEILLGDVIDVLARTEAGKKTTSFDEYCFYDYKCGKTAVLDSYKRPYDYSANQHIMTQEERIIIQENLRQNVIQTAKDYPQTVFYLYFPLYNICYYDSRNLYGVLELFFETEKVAIEEILNSDCNNIKLFAFSDKFDIICNFDCYIDILHTTDSVNSAILQWIHDGEGELTKDNYLDYINKCYEFYSQYDYDSIYQ